MYESLSDWGETLCAASPNQTTIITGGASSVVCVWDVLASKDKVSGVKLRQVRLFFHLFSHLIFYLRVPACLDSSPLTASVRPHGRRDVPGCVRGPHHDSERLP